MRRFYLIMQCSIFKQCINIANVHQHVLSLSIASLQVLWVIVQPTSYNLDIEFKIFLSILMLYLVNVFVIGCNLWIITFACVICLANAVHGCHRRNGWGIVCDIRLSNLPDCQLMAVAVGYPKAVMIFNDKTLQTLSKL